MLLFAVILTVLVSLWLLSLCWDRAHPYYISLYTSIFWNMPLTFGLEGYIEFAVASFINLHLFHWITISDIFNSVACIAGLTLTVFLPPFVLWFLVKNRGKLNQPENKQKFSSLYEGLEKQNVWGLYFTFLFLFKRLIIAVVVVFLQGMPWLQIQIVVFMLSLDIIYTGYLQPFNKKFSNRMEIINNVFIMLCSYYLFLFTAFVPSPVT